MIEIEFVVIRMAAPAQAIDNLVMGDPQHPGERPRAAFEAGGMAPYLVHDFVQDFSGVGRVAQAFECERVNPRVVRVVEGFQRECFAPGDPGQQSASLIRFLTGVLMHAPQLRGTLQGVRISRIGLWPITVPSSLMASTRHR